MKKNSPVPHDPLDELLTAAVHNELTPGQRAELAALLQNDPAARAAHQEIQAMHDLLERNHRPAQPDPAFEDRLISGVRQAAARRAPRETAWESALFLWHGLGAILRRPSWKAYAGALAIIMILAGVALGPITNGIKRARAPHEFVTMVPGKELAVMDDLKAKEELQVPASAELRQAEDAPKPVDAPPHLQDQAQQLAQLQAPASPSQVMDFQKPPLSSQSAGNQKDLAKVAREQGIDYVETAQKGVTLSGYVDTSSMAQFAGKLDKVTSALKANEAKKTKSASGSGEGFASDGGEGMAAGGLATDATAPAPSAAPAAANPAVASTTAPSSETTSAPASPPAAVAVAAMPPAAPAGKTVDENSASANAPASPPVPVQSGADVAATPVPSTSTTPAHAASSAATPEPSRKLVRDAQLDLEVKSYQPTVDAITALAHADGGYLDSSNSQRGGNGKLQGSVVAKVAPENLDAFLLKLRDFGTIKNQSVSTEDVTKDYYDTQARLDNSRRMETQLQQLLQHSNSKVADLLQVERELGRVRGDIEQMQGQLKLYDFQVQYATVTISVAEKDLHQAAAFLLKENDQFSLFVGDVEDTFAQAKGAAATFHAEILNADLERASDNTLNATLSFSVPPDQIDGFLAKVKGLGRVDNFTRQTQRVANDGGDPSDPSDETRTEKDHVQVQLTIRADDESPRQQTQLAVASTGDIDAQAQALKDGAPAAGATVTASNFQRAPDGTETATIGFRVPLAKAGDLLVTLEKLGRVESLTVQRNDRPNQTAADPGAPAEIDLTLHNVPAVRFEDQAPRQQTQLAVASAGDVDAQAQQLKSDALQAGFAVTNSTFERSPEGTEQAALTFRLPLVRAAAFTATLEKLGKVESLAVQRNDVPGPGMTDPNAPAEVSLNLHTVPAIVAENRGLWTTLRNTFGGSIAAFLGSVQTIGVLAAFLLPWAALVILGAWTGRRIYVARRQVKV